jgi:hypothetical protein
VIGSEEIVKFQTFNFHPFAYSFEFSSS